MTVTVPFSIDKPRSRAFPERLQEAPRCGGQQGLEPRLLEPRDSRRCQRMLEAVAVPVGGGVRSVGLLTPDVSTQV